MITLHIYSNRHIKTSVPNIKHGDWVYLENSLSRKRWSLFFKYCNIDESKLEITYITQKEYFDLRRTRNNMTLTFNTIIGNPPYNIGLEQHKYIEFVRTALKLGSSNSEFIIPTAWAYSTRFKKFLNELKLHGLKKVEFLDRLEFPGIHQDVCKIFLETNYDNDIIIVNKQKITSTVKRSATKLIPASDLMSENILRKLANRPGLTLEYGSNKTVRHHGEKIFDEYISSNETEHHKFKLLSRLGGAENKNEVYWISTVALISPTFKIATARLQPGTGKVSHWQLVDPLLAISEALVYLCFTEFDQAQNCLAYLKSKIVKFILSEEMQTARMSKSLIKKIPEINLSKSWTDAEIYDHFGLTQEEIDYVEANVK